MVFAAPGRIVETSPDWERNAVMKPVEANAALGTVAPQTAQPHICSTSPIGNPQLDLWAKPASAAVSAAPVLITEQQVLISTAAAVPLRPTRVRWWPKTTAAVLVAMHRMLLTSAVDSREPHQDHPRRNEFLENSCMAREMDRL
jgi:hypothetical protein